jgi:diguanylate cyclase (GGDEF)-like protein
MARLYMRGFARDSQLTFPMVDVDTAPDEPTGAAAPSLRRSQRILVVEDEAVVALDLQLLLEEMGYAVVATAASCEEACSKVLEELPDLVLMDVRIDGEVDGIETGARLRSQHQIPIIYVTGNADDLTLSRALETEPDGYLAKPFDASTLRATIEVALRRHRSRLKAHKMTNRLRREAVVDTLTGLYNRRRLDAAITQEIGRAERTGVPFGVILLDLDHFKQVNDRFGHLAGDSVLRDVAHCLRERLRADDIACRYGGEELAIVLPGATLIDAAAVAEGLRFAIADLVVSTVGEAIRTTASFGVAACPEHGSDGPSLFRAADAAVYAAKRAGRNRVVAAGPA